MPNVVETVYYSNGYSIVVYDSGNACVKLKTPLGETLTTVCGTKQACENWLSTMGISK